MAEKRIVVFGTSFPPSIPKLGYGRVEEGPVAAGRGPTKGLVWVYVRGEEGWHMALELSREDAARLRDVLSAHLGSSKKGSSK